MLAGLVARGALVRIPAAGREADLDRLRAHCAALDGPGATEIVPMAATTSDEAVHDIDALVLHSLPMEQCWAWVTTGRLVHRLPTVQYVQGLQLADPERVMWADLWRGWSGSPPARLLVPNAATDARLDLLAADAVHHGAAIPPAAVVPLGVDLHAVRGGSRAVGRGRLGLTDARRVALSIGRISSAEGPYHQLILAFADLVDAGADDIDLVLADAETDHDEPYVAALRRLARQLGVGDRIHVVAGLNGTDKPDLLAAADVMVSLVVNARGSSGNALVEGLAAGLPVVAADWGGSGEVLPGVYRERLIPTVASRDVAAAVDPRFAAEAATTRFVDLVERLAEALAGGEAMRRIAALGPEHAAAHGWDTAVDRLLGLIDELASAGAAPTRQLPAGERTLTVIDRLASSELGAETRLRVADISPGARSAALGFASLAAAGLHADRGNGRRRAVDRLPGLGGGDDPLRTSSRRRRIICDRILERCGSAGATGARLADLRSGITAPTPHVEWLLLKLIQTGAVTVPVR